MVNIMFDISEKLKVKSLQINIFKILIVKDETFYLWLYQQFYSYEAPNVVKQK